MLPSLHLGRYILEGLLGPGGVTETYLARQDHADTATHAKADCLWAVKLLRADRVPSEVLAAATRRFVAAGRHLRDFHRPGFAKVLELHEGADAAFLVSEHVSGRNLAQLQEISRREHRNGSAWLEPNLVGLIGAEIARLLHVAHMAKPPLFHLGLAPQNVIVTAAGEVVLLDAGIAAALRAITEQPPERWWFVAPEMQGVDVGERALGQREGVACDLYSLGALLWFLITGCSSNEASSLAGRAVEDVQVGELDIPSRLSAAIRTLTAPDPEFRPESAAAIVDGLGGGIGSARERQGLIAEGVHAMATGARPDDSSLRVSEPTLVRLPHANPSPRRRILLLLFAIGVAGLTAAIWATGAWRMGSRDNLAGQARKWREGLHAPMQVLSHAQRDGSPGSKPSVREGLVLRDDNQTEVRVAGHLVVETTPPGATVWVDGVESGKTFLDLVVGEGGHRIVLVAAGYHIFREGVDTTLGAILRPTLSPVLPPTYGNGFLNIECQSNGKLPILIDDEETGLLCPAKMVPAQAGRHLVGVFVPRDRRTLSVETTVEIGAKAAEVSFRE